MKYNHLTSFAVSAILACASANSLAQATENITNNKTENTSNQLSSIVVSASPVHQHSVFETPSQVDILLGEEKVFAESGSLAEMLETKAGINNLQTGSQAGKPVIRGLTGNRVKVTSNGSASDYQAYGERHNPNIDPFLAERIEVIRGPNSVLFGAEAMGGVVNVLSPEFKTENGISGDVRGEFNSNNLETHTGTKVKLRADKFALNFGLSKRGGDDFRTGSAKAWRAGETNDKPAFTGKVPFTNFENLAGEIQLGFIDDWGQVSLSHSDWQSKQNYLGLHAHNDHFHEEAEGQILRNQQTQLAGEIFAGDWVLKPKFTHSKNQREEAHDAGFKTMRQHKDDHYLDLVVEIDELKFGIEHPEVFGFAGEFGVELAKLEQTLRNGDLTPSAEQNSYAVYLFEEKDLDNWLFQFGTRYDKTKIKVPLNGRNNAGFAGFDASNNQQDFSVFTSSFGATYKFADNWAVAANLGQGFRAPSIFELYAGGTHGGVQAYQVGNPDLKAEKSLNLDLSLRYQSEQAGVVATVYQNKIDDFIYMERTGRTVDHDGNACSVGHCFDEMKNQQTDARIRGFELSSWLQVTDKITTSAALEIIDGKDVKNNRKLGLMPANNLRLTAEYNAGSFGKLQENLFSLSAKLVAAKNSAGEYEAFSQYDAAPFGTSSTKAYQLYDFAYQAKLPLDNQQLSLGFAIENIFDTDYRDFLDTYKGYALGQGRNFKFIANLKF